MPIDARRVRPGFRLPSSLRGGAWRLRAVPHQLPVLSARIGDVQGLGTVAASRGRGCFDLAQLLTDEPVRRIEGDLLRSCIEQRVDALVARRLTKFDLVPTLAPYDVEFDEIGSVAAAVGEGPHSPLATAVAVRLGSRLAVPVEVATVYRREEERAEAMLRLERLAEPYPDLSRRAVRRPAAPRLTDTLEPASLLVVGASGGGWFYRQIYGPGHRLLVKAPAGAVVVRDTARRCFQDAEDPTPTAVGVHLSIADARRVIAHRVVPVAEEGRLVGILRAAALAAAAPDQPVAAVMEPPVAVVTTEPLEVARELRHHLEGGPVPVVDEEGWLVGILPWREDGRSGEAPEAPVG